MSIWVIFKHSEGSHSAVLCQSVRIRGESGNRQLLCSCGSAEQASVYAKEPEDDVTKIFEDITIAIMQKQPVIQVHLRAASLETGSETLDNSASQHSTSLSKVDSRPSWRPKLGERYNYVREDGEILSAPWYGTAGDVAMCVFGNCFRTGKEAATHVFEVQAKINKVLRG